MRPDSADLVFPVLRAGLDLRDDWAAGRGPLFAVGRDGLRDRVRAVVRRFPAAAGIASLRPPDGPVDLLGGGPDPAGPDTEPFLGVGYPLACWADELFTNDPRHGRQWNEQKFEVEFFGSNDRAWRFWRQSRLAGDRPGDDLLEVFFLCVALGFKGEWADEPDKRLGWFAATRDRLLKGGLAADWAGPAALDPPGPAAPRDAVAGLRRMAAVGGAAVLVAVPAAAVLIARHVGR